MYVDMSKLLELFAMQEASDEKLVTLVIEKVFPQMFRSYSLAVCSSLGHGNGSISLERSESIDKLAVILL